LRSCCDAVDAFGAPFFGKSKILEAATRSRRAGERPDLIGEVIGKIDGIRYRSGTRLIVR
jgi:hypothetical protein